MYRIPARMNVDPRINRSTAAAIDNAANYSPAVEEGFSPSRDSLGGRRPPNKPVFLDDRTRSALGKAVAACRQRDPEWSRQITFEAS